MCKFIFASSFFLFYSCGLTILIQGYFQKARKWPSCYHWNSIILIYRFIYGAVGESGADGGGASGAGGGGGGCVHVGGG